MEDKKEEKVFSHSRLCLFENCPEAYKVKYIYKKFPDLPESIEAFLGKTVHESLEWLYNEVKKRDINLDDVIEYYLKNWNDKFSEDIRVKNGNKEIYYNKGIKFLVDYYQKHKPFSDNTIETEKEILFDLDEDGEYKIKGYIDRIVLNEDGEYEVHDYKTNSNLKTEDEIKKDRQLALYNIGLKKLLGNHTKVKLIWHFLAHNQSIISYRTEEELEKLKRDTLELIKKIENNTEWPACGRSFCDWCEFKRVNGLDRFI